MNSKKQRKLMAEMDSQAYDPTKHFTNDQLPDDTLTVVLKSGGKTYAMGIKLPDTQEKTAALAGNMMQTVIDTIDAKGLKKGGSRFDPDNKEKTDAKV